MRKATTHARTISVSLSARHRRSLDVIVERVCAQHARTTRSAIIEWCLDQCMSELAQKYGVDPETL